MICQEINNLIIFLNNYTYKSSFNISSYTNNIIGKYYIPLKKLSEFIKLYVICLNKGLKLSILENISDINPIIININLKLCETNNYEFIICLIKQYIEIIKEYLIINENHFIISIFKKNNKYTKFYIIFNNCICDIQMRNFIDKEVIKRFYHNKNILSLSNVGNVYLYGSQEPDQEYGYKLFKIFIDTQMNEYNINKLSLEDIIKYSSFIYNKKYNINHKNKQKSIIKNLFNDNQLLFINSDIKNCVVLGNPGCGKTKTIIEYCIDKFNKNIIKTSKNFFIISFSKKAQTDFIKRGKTSSQPILFNNMNVKTIHSLAVLIFNKLFNKTSKTINTIILATYKNLLSNPKNLNNIYVLSNCLFIIIDEAQDINENQYNLIMLISKLLNIPLILVGDPNQNIYQFQGGSDKFLMNHNKETQFYLTHNYRSTNQIIQFCNYIRPHNFLPQMISGKNINNSKPLIYCNTIDNILKHIKIELTNNEYKLHDIAIIGPVKLSHPINDEYWNIGLQLICNYLEKENIKYIKHFTDPENKEFNNQKNFEIKENYVNIITSHGSKGLEFKKTLVINFHLNTFSKKPTEEEYIKYKYLWYVTLSRAIDKLIIYVDSSKKIFPDIFNVPNELYTTNTHIDKYKLDFKNNDKPHRFTITDMLNNNDYFNENTFYEFNNLFKYSIQKEQLFVIDNTNIFENDIYSCLYGLFIEDLFEFYYYKNKNNLLTLINIRKQKLNNILFITNEEDIIIYKKLQKKNFIDSNGILILQKYYEIDKNKLSNQEQQFILWCYNKLKLNMIIIYIKNKVFTYDKNYLIKLYDSLLLNFDEKIIFDIVLYFYQIQNECEYLLNHDFTQHLKSLETYYIHLDNLSKQYNNFQFNIHNSHTNIKLTGYIDILHDNKIIDLKFINSINEKHIIQILLYYNNYSIDWSIKKDLEIWNIKDGYKYIIEFDNNITCWNINCFICKILDIKMFNNIFILDLETNTKNINIDFTEPSNTEIIDRFVYEYNFNCIVSDGLIKNISPLTTSFITNITDEDLINADTNLSKFKSEMDKVLLYCDKPLFIGHNAKRFDFPILFYYNLLDKNKIKLLDSMHYLPLLIPNKNISKKLIDLYNYVFNTNIKQTHRAKGDTILIVDICRKLNISSEDMINMCDDSNH